jgi:hypothetical protein
MPHCFSFRKPAYCTDLFYLYSVVYVIVILFFRLREVSEKLNRFGSVTPAALSNLKIAVKCIVVGPNHFALLLEDGRVCRVSFSIISDRLDLSKNDPNKR